jgi:hypothetical protein
MDQERETALRITAAKTVYTHLIQIDVRAALCGSAALLFHGIQRDTPHDLDFAVFGQQDRNHVKKALLQAYPEVYEVAGTHLYFLSGPARTCVEFLIAGPSSTLAWLRFDASPGNIDLRNGVGVLSLELNLLSKMSACNTRLRTRLAHQAEKGQKDKANVLLVAKTLSEREKTVSCSWTRGALISHLWSFLPLKNGRFYVVLEFQWPKRCGDGHFSAIWFCFVWTLLLALKAVTLGSSLQFSQRELCNVVLSIKRQRVIHVRLKNSSAGLDHVLSVFPCNHYVY